MIEAPAAATVLAISLAAVWLLAATSKAMSWRNHVEWLTALGVPWPLPLAALTIGAEIAVAILLTTFAVWPGLLSASGLVVATAALWRSRALSIGCGCFGPSTRTPDVMSFLRNGVLMVASLGLAVLSTSRSLTATAIFSIALLAPLAWQLLPRRGSQTWI